MDRVANLPTTSEEEDPLRPLLNRADLEPKRQTQKSVRVALHGSGNGKRVFNLGVLVKEVTLSLDDLKRFTCVDYPQDVWNSILGFSDLSGVRVHLHRGWVFSKNCAQKVLSHEAAAYEAKSPVLYGLQPPPSALNKPTRFPRSAMRV